MPLFPNDFKKFKHLKSDDKTTTLEHPKGHTITIMHSALKGPMRAQLEALAKGGQVEKKMHDGGKAYAEERRVESEENRTGNRGTQNKVGQEVEDIRHPNLDKDASDIIAEANAGYSAEHPNSSNGPSSPTKAEQRKAAGYSEKPSNVSGSYPKFEKSEPLEQRAQPYEKYAPKGLAEGGSVQMYAEGAEIQPNPDLERKRELYNNMVELDVPTVPFEERKFDSRINGKIDNANRMFGPKGEEPAQFDTNNWNKAEQAYQNEKAVNAAQTAEEQQKAIALNSSRVSAGLQPVPVPNVPDGPQMPQTQMAAAQQPMQEAPVAAPQTSQGAQVNAGMNQQIRGINDEEAAKSQLGTDQLAALATAHRFQADTQSLYKQNFDALEAERQHLIQDVQEGHIDPEKFWTGDKDGNGGHSRLASAIGMIIAGFNPTNSPNAAINFLKYQMDQNLEAQKQNLSSNQNLLSANLRQFGNIKEAMDMTRIQQSDIAQNELAQAAAKATSPMAKAAAMQAIGQLKAENDVKHAKFAEQLTTNSLIREARQNPAQAEMIMRDLDERDPAKAKEMRPLFVPGLGFANSVEGAKGVIEAQATAKTVQEGIAELQKIIGQTGKSISPDLRAKADSIRKQLVGRLRVPITGPGAMSEGEREILLDLIPDVTSMTSLDSRSKVRLNQLQKAVDTSYRNMAAANGLQIPKTKDDNNIVNNERAQAEAWLKANPNHPKAEAARRALGVK